MEERLRYEGTLPSLGLLSLQAAVKRRGSPKESDERPELVAAARRVQVDPWEVRRYCEVCGIGADGTLPPTYPQVLATPLHGAILAADEFPLPVLGLVHLENRVVQHRRIAAEERLEITCAVREWEWDPYRGRRFSLITEMRVMRELVWESELWALCRGKSRDLQERPPREPRQESAPSGEPQRLVSSVVELPEDLGRRYASVCGDYNPIHLHPWTAKPFGFKRPIIHGMWTLARCWAALSEVTDAEALRLSVQFRRPLYLPSRALIGVEQSGPGRLEYVCESLDRRKVYVRGVLQEGSGK